MLIAAAVVPAPPVLVPDVAARAAPELDDVRAAIGQAMTVLVAASPDVLVCVGSADETVRYPSGSRGTLRGLGIEFDVALGAGEVEEQQLPLSLTLLAWLIGECGWTGDVLGQSVAGDLDPDDALKLGASLASERVRVALVVGGDGSATLTAKSPGYVVPGAVDWQAAASQALAQADAATLSALTVDDGERFRAAGRAPWQVLVGAAGVGAWRGQGLASVSPYGVAYDVVVWEPAVR